jgi:deoxynucleoside triphosphate triphosphohydrolase SAMHD1
LFIRFVANELIKLNTLSLINSARVVENQICYDIKDANQIYELCYTRFSLHKRIYNHKTGASARDLTPVWILNEESTAKAIENMMVDAMLAAEPYLNISSQIYDPRKYLELTDDIRTEIQRSQAPVSTYVFRISSALDDNTWF